jgi:tRNA 2-thiouridine synthesizing protein A
MTMPVEPTKPAWNYALEFEGGDKSCGELILELKLFIQDLPAGTRLLVIARDPGAWIDIPAWCRLTGHEYVNEAPPYYLIQRR